MTDTTPEPQPTAELIEMAPDETVTVTPLPPIPGRAMTIGFERNIRPAEYESAKASASTTFVVPDDFPIDRLSELVENEFAQVRSAIYQQLGIAFTRDETTRVLVEAFPGSHQVAGAAQAPNPSPFAGTPFTPAAVTPAAATAVPPAAPAPAGPKPGWNEMAANPLAWTDNRGSKQSERSPDFVHSTATYVDKNGKTQKVALWIESQYDPCPPAIRQQLGI